MASGCGGRGACVEVCAELEAELAQLPEEEALAHGHGEWVHPRRTCRWDELAEAGSFSKLRSSGKLRQEGKEYVVQDGDAMLFRFSVQGGGLFR